MTLELDILDDENHGSDADTLRQCETLHHIEDNMLDYSPSIG
jgi:hypothetical protein